MHAIIKKIFFVFALISFSNAMSANDYYVYVCAESEDEVALIKFDGKRAVVEKTIGTVSVQDFSPMRSTVAYFALSSL